ncbi:hypothetical protein RDI58_002088 [Solanum bulbocastanum]|uniref:NAC domain-containing protein n=1 Tax=Solanum bulbocastanum TaxID=147425 RepID=A0AAN8U655_SOLBU
MNFLVNAVKLHFNRNWTRKDMMSSAPIPQHAYKQSTALLLHFSSSVFRFRFLSAKMKNAVKAYFERKWNREDMTNPDEIPLRAYESLKRELDKTRHDELCTNYPARLHKLEDAKVRMERSHIYITSLINTCILILLWFDVSQWTLKELDKTRHDEFCTNYRACLHKLEDEIFLSSTVVRFLQGASMVFGCFLLAVRVHRERSQMYIIGLIHTCTLILLRFDISQWTLKGLENRSADKYRLPYRIRSQRLARWTWKGETGEPLIRRNRTAPVVGFKRNFKFETSERGKNKTWLMVEYHVADSFFKENNHIPKEDFVVCRIKKKMDKEKNVDYVMEAQDGDVTGIIDRMLLEPNHNNDYSATEDQVRVCDEEDAIEATTSEYDVQNGTYEATTMENTETTLEVQEGHGVDDIRSNEFQEEMYRTFEDIPVDIPDDWLQNSHVLQNI